MKRLGIMQPYFFPYIGYFSLIKHTDEFILFDTAQFMRHGWIERNRILKQNEGWLYIKVPLRKHNQQTPIKEIEIDNSTDWKSKIFSQLEIYKKIAPNYDAVCSLLYEVFKPEYNSISEINHSAIKAVCEYLRITTKISVFSEMKLHIEPVHAADEWALNICKAMPGVTEYWNPPGGRDFFDTMKYRATGINVEFQEVIIEKYNQFREPFIPGLSIIDVMMFNSIESVNQQLDKYRLIK